MSAAQVLAMDENDSEALVTTQAAAARLGLIPSTFRRRAERLGLNYDCWDRIGHGRYSRIQHYWSDDVIEAVRADVQARPGRILTPQQRAERAAARDAQVAERRAKVEAEWAARARRVQEIRSAVRDRYPTWRDAIPDAAEAMHRLNRLAYRVGGQSADIYAVKNKLVEFLYREGLCQRAEIHLQTPRAKECWGCDGTGERYDGDCYRCGGTGFYQPEYVIRLYCFYFEVAGTSYSWHQPESLVTWPVTTTGEPRPMPALPSEREHGLSTFEQIDEAMEIVRLVVEGASGAPKGGAS